MTIDLRELMRERSAAAEAPVRTERVAEVRRRIAVVRRRRVAGAVLATCAVVAAVATGATLLPRQPNSAPQPADPTITEFPEYQAGARVIAVGAAELPDTEVAVTVIPETLDLAFAVRCDTPLFIEVRVAGADEMMGTSCDRAGGSVLRPQGGPAFLERYGLAPGQPATFTATATHAVGSGVAEMPLPDNGAFALAVMHRVPFEEYRFPPRPATLSPVDDRTLPQAEVLLRSDPDDPLLPVSGTMIWWSSVDLAIVSQTPGYVHVSIEGMPVVTHESWGYEQGVTISGVGDRGLGFPEGTTVTITAVPEHVTGAWTLYAMPGSSAESAADGAVTRAGDE